MATTPTSARPGTRVLGMKEMRQLLSLEETIELQRRAFASQAHDRTVAAPNSWLRLPGIGVRG